MDKWKLLNEIEDSADFSMNITEEYLLEGTKYDAQAIKILDDANLFSHETNEKIIQLLYKGDEENEPDIHAFVHSPNWLMKYLKGIARMLVEYAEGSSTKAQEFLGEAPSVFEPVLTWVKTNRTDKNAKELDDNFVNKFSFQDVKDFLDEIHSQEQEISDKKLADLDTSKKSGYTLIPINSYEEMREFGNNVTGDSSISVSSPWCYATGRGTYDYWISGDTNKMYVLAKDEYEKIKPEKTVNNPKDKYGLSLIGIRVDVKTGKLLNATLRWNHLNVPTNADNQFTNYGELSEIVGFNVKEAVEADLDAERERLERLLENLDQYYYDKMLKTGVCDVKTIEEEHRGIIEKIIVPDNIEEIGESAFDNCESLTSITLPNSVVEIGESAFGYCESLTSITIPNSVEKIDGSAFRYCESLTSITLPNSVKEIGHYAFYGCKSLTSITIPNSVEKIDGSAFDNCESLTSITLPNSVREIGRGAFYGCKSLTSITLPNSVKEIGHYAFYGCKSLTSITIPNSIKEIGRYAFAGCNSLTSITIPNSIKEIGGYAFAGCNSLKDVYIVGKTSLKEQERIRGLLGIAGVDFNKINLHFNVQEDLEIGLKEEYLDNDKKVYATSSVYDAVNRLKSSKKSLRILWDRKIGYYFICDALDYIHSRMVEMALEQGYYENLQEWQLVNYLDSENENVVYYVYTPKGLEEQTYGSNIGEDGYDEEYLYDFGTLTVREYDKSKSSPLVKALGKYKEHYEQDGWSSNDPYKPHVVLVESLEDEYTLLQETFENYYKIIDTPPKQSSYLLQDGKFLDLNEATHGVFDIECDEACVHFDFLDSAIKLNTATSSEDFISYPYVELSRGITNKQIEGLEKWLDLLVVQGATSVEIGLKKYSLKDNTVDELIKKIKRYNVTGVLVEQSVGQEQYFKNSKIRDKNGNLLVVYHGSPSKGFKEFGMKLGGKFNPGSDKLMYFTDDYASAEVFSHETVPSSKSFTQVKRTGVSGEVRGFYLNITNPLDLTQLSKAEKELIAKNYADSQNGIKELDKADRKYIDFVNKTIQQIEDADKTNFSQYIKIFIEPCGIRNFLEKYGYDGMIAKMYYGKGSSYDGVRNDALEFAVLNSNQIKLIDNDTPTSSSKIDETLLIESDYNNKINKDSDEDIDGSINEAVKTNSFTPYTAGYILEDGSLLVMDEYHGETEIREFYPEYSNTHPEEDTCVRLYSRPNEAQYKRLEEIIDYYLNHEFYCKVEVWDKPLGKYSFYEVYSLYEGACRDTTWNEKIGNWTGYKLVQIIKNYFAKRVVESDVLDDRFTLKVGFNTIVGDDSGDLEEEFELTEVLPTNNETKEEFIARFMKETEEEYPNPKQRYAVALKYWEKRLAETFEGTEVKKGVRNKMKTKGFLEERFERNETLNPKLWDGDELKEEVRDKIYQIVDAFVAGLTDDNIEISVEDIVLIGSNASYNYSEQSDLDVHVIVDTSNLNCPDGLYPLLYSAYRSIFNKKYEIEFYGIDVELYIDEENTQTVSNGVYSLTQGWIKPPVREDIPEIDEEAFEEMFSEWEDEYFNIVQGEVIPDEKPIQPVTESLESNKIEEIENFIEDIYDLRKVSLSKQGEYSLGNLVFKEFRNLGYLDNLKALKSKLKSQELSITETYKLRESKDMNDYYTLESIKALAEEVQTDNRDGTYSIGEDGKLVKEDLTKGMQTSFFRPEITNSEIKEVLNVIGDSFGKAYLGLWYGDGEISYTLDLETAEKVAKIFNQQAVWDNGGGKSIDNADYDKTRKVDYKAATEELRKLLKK